MNLAAADLKQSPLLAGLPPFENLCWEGEVSPKILSFRGSSQKKSVQLYSLSVIRREEVSVWKSFQEMLDYASKMTAQSLLGFYGFDILSLDLKKAAGNFQPLRFMELLVNHSKKLQPGESVLIPYASVYGLFKKRIPEDWGKLELKVYGEVFSKDPEQLDLALKRLVKTASENAEKKILLLQDYSFEPVFRFGSELQTERLKSFLENLAKQPVSNGMEIYIKDHSGLVELFAQFGIREAHV